jgi:hypothetical protein
MDDEMIERLLASPATAAEEAPELAMLLAAASTYPTDLGLVAGQEAALAAFRAGGVAAPPRRKRMLGKALASKTLAMLGAGTLVLGGGVAAAAAADTLPVPAQNAISGAASHVGLDFPSHAQGNHHGWQNSNNPHHQGNGNDNQGTDNGNKDNSNQPDNHGAYVSGVARSASPGPGHGKTVSDAAHSQDGKPTPAQSHGPDANATDHGATNQSQAGDGAPEPQENETSEAPETDTSGAPSGLGSGHAPGSHG